MRSLLILSMLLSLLFVGEACSHGRKKNAGKPPEPPQTVPKKMKEYELHGLIPYTLRVRRPPGPGAHPQASEGGTDFRSDPLPNARFDCETPDAFMRDIKLDAVRECIASIKDPYIAHLGVRWVAVPTLELEVDEDETPACLNETLASLPVPREIFYQNNEDGRMECYSSRLSIEIDEMAGFKMPIKRRAVRIEFPLAKPPTNADETRMLLMSWVLTPFFGKSGRTIVGYLVPSPICVKCLGEGTMLGRVGPPHKHWPEPVPSVTPSPTPSPSISPLPSKS